MSEQKQTGAAVVPNLIVDAVEPVRSFYMDELDFRHMMGMVGKDGNLDFCSVSRDGVMIMLARPTEKTKGSAPSYPTKCPIEIYMYVKDVAGYHDEVRRRGATITAPLTTQWWGACAWPTTTRHLHILEAAGLVRVVKKGRERVYQLEASRLRSIAGAWLAWFGARSRARATTRPGGAVRPVP